MGDSAPNSFTVPKGSIDTNGSGHRVNAGASSNQGPSLSLMQMRSGGTTNGTFSDLSQAYSPTAARSFQDTKHSDYGSGDNPFRESDIKNFDSDARRRGKDGNSLLSSIQTVGEGPTDLGAPRVGAPPATVPEVQKKISEVIRNNRFNPIDKSFVQDKARTDVGYTIQKEMGKYDPNALRVSEKKLMGVGASVVLKSAGAGSLKTLAAGIPIISTGDTRAQSVNVSESASGQERVAALSGEQYTSFNSSEYTSDSTQRSSYGVMNSPIERFSETGMISSARNLAVLSAAAAAAGGIVSLFELLNSTVFFRKINVGVSSISTNSPQITNFNIPTDLSHIAGYNLALGHHKTVSASEYERPRGAAGVLGQVVLDPLTSFYNKIFLSYTASVPKTQYKLTDAILRGLTIFLTDINSDSQGYIGTLARSISRDTYISTVEGVSSISSSMVSLSSLADLGNPLINYSAVESAAQRSINLFESLFKSQAFSFVMALAVIGDRALTLELYEDEKKEDASSQIERGLRVHAASRISEFGYIPGNDLGSTSGHALTWKHSSTPSLYILPQSLKNALQAYSRLPGLEKKYGISWSGEITDKKRLDSSKVQEIEENLESEYMPFYFHDLRTNEVISFHAFLSDLSDGFTASYDSVAGYGRGDEVMTYKNTKRSISFSFSVVATSVEDLDVMYWNINKLITMLYPQYSRGRAMSSGPDKFIQPFSQIPTASPLIRLRIGDVIKGNYSRFGIARLFGLGEPKNIFSPQVSIPETPPPPEQPVTAPPAPPASPSPIATPEGRYAVGQVISIRPGISTQNRFINQEGNSNESVRHNAVAFNTQRHFRHDVVGNSASIQAPWNPPAAMAQVEASRAILNNPIQQANQVGRINEGATITAGRTRILPSGDIPVPAPIPRALRRMPRKNQAKITGISVVNGKTVYRVEITKLTFRSVRAETIRSNFDTREFTSDEIGPRRVPNPFTDIATTEATVNRTVDVNFLRKLREFNHMDLDESEIVEPRIRTNSRNDESATAQNDADTSAPSGTRGQNQEIKAVQEDSTPPQSLNEFLSSGKLGNPIIRSFESTRGRGLAGFITDIKFDWNESTWEIDQGKRAPKFMKINISFSPIHDIPMGLDNNGAMRSVAYNIGGLSQTIGDDPYDKYEGSD